MAKIKKFGQFNSIQEASLEDNPAIPGEGPGGENEPKYRSDVERRAKDDIAAIRRKYGAQAANFMSLVMEAQRIQRGYENPLEDLAESMIMQMFGDILENVKLNIKLNKEEVAKNIESAENEPPAPQEVERLKDLDLIAEINKRKIIRNIVQGEALNTKLCLEMPETLQGLIEILGEAPGRRYHFLMIAITEINITNDWEIPVEFQKQMWFSRQGFAGAVKLEWNEEDKEKEDEELAQKILKDLENEETDIKDNEDVKELFDHIGPIINAAGVDFAMLIHETIKGIYDLIGTAGIPEDETVSQTVIDNTDTLLDELEDIRYGRYIAADLRDFLNEYPESDTITNFREHFFGKLVVLPAADFLDLIKSILLKDPSAKAKAKPLIDEIKDDFKSYGEDLANAALDDMGDDYYTNQAEETPEEDLSPKEIQDLIDAALDNGDFKEVARLSKFLGESLKNYEQTLNENVQAAKAYMLSKFSKKKAGQLTKEEETEILSDKEYQEIKNVILAKFPGWVYAFVRFHFDQGASLQDLISLRDELVRYKPLLGSLPMTIDQYARVENIPKEVKLKKLDSELKRAEESGDENRIADIQNQIKNVNSEEITDTRPGVERLQDELRYIEREREARWLIDALPARAASVIGKPINLRDEYRNADKETKDEIINIGSLISKADNSEDVKKRFLKKISAFDSIKRLAEFGGSFVKSLGSNIDKLSQQAEALYPGVAIMYEDDQYIALSLRSENAQKELCSAANWCINRGSFWSYAKGNVQLNIFNFSLPQTDRYFLIGITVTQDGTVRNSHDVNDSSIMKSGEKYYDQLKRMGYPEKMIEEIKKYFNLEYEVKQLTDTFYQGGNQINQAVDRFLKYSYKFTDDPSFERVKSIFFDIVNQDIAATRNESSKIKTVFEKNGIMNSVSAEIFDSIFPDPDEEFMKNVSAMTLKNLLSAENFRKMIETDPNFIGKFKTSNPGLYDNILAMLKEKDETTNKIRIYIPKVVGRDDWEEMEIPELSDILKAYIEKRK